MSRNARSTTASVTNTVHLRAKHVIAALLISSVFFAAVAISGANGAFGQQWKRLSMRMWHQAGLAALQMPDPSSEYQETVLPVRLIGFFRPNARTVVTESAAASASPLQTSVSAPVTSAAVPAQAMVTGGRQSTYARQAPPATYQLPITLPYVDRSSAAYTRFKGWVDSAVSGSPGYGFAAIEAAMMYQLSPEAKYCTLAVNMVEKQVSSAESAIAAAGRPAIAGDSYLDVGPMISDLAMTMRTCSATITTAQRQRWSAYAEQAIWNIWNFNNAQWGGRSFPWSGWSTDNPGNNYYYSFVEATMYWALASGNVTWINELRDRRLPALQAYFAKLPGGGSSEGTGYGTSHMRLFSIYHLWYVATGIDLANANPHTTDSIYYWINATVPTLDRFAPIGDQSRNSIPELYDYHRRLMLEARYDTNSQVAQNAATWWLKNIYLKNGSGTPVQNQMNSGFNFRYDLLPAGTTSTQPTDLTYYAPGVGHLFSRTGWDKNAMWVAIVAGPYKESHAHQDQGSFTLFSQDWLAVTANIWSHSGINQGTDVHNLVRFIRNGTVARQCTSTTRASTIAITPGTAGAFTANANLTPAFCDNTAVTSWQRQFTFGSRKLTVRDTFAMTAGTTATFQVNVPVVPTLVNSREATAGRLRVRVLEPANATINSNFSTGKYVEDGARYRIDVSGGTTGYLVELSEI
ncbi:MAG: hypothetical protein ABI538_01900 [Pseudoxanthomonas sp.]